MGLRSVWRTRRRRPVGERREGAGARRSGTGEAPGRDRMAVGSPPPAGRSLDQAAWGSPARCGRSGFPVAVGPAVGAHGGDGGPECQWPLNIAHIAGDPVAVAAATATGSPAAGSGPFMPPSFRLRIPVRRPLGRRSDGSPWRARRGGAAGGPVRTGAGMANCWGILAGLRFVSLPESRAFPSPATKRPRRVDAKRRPRTSTSASSDRFSGSRSTRSTSWASWSEGRTSSCGVRPGWAQRLEPSAGPTSKTRIRPAPLEGEEIGTLRVRPSGAVRLVQRGNRRDEPTSTELTWNPALEPWGQILGEQVMAVLVNRVRPCGHSDRRRRAAELSKGAPSGRPPKMG